jgi:hypothetical protein
MLHGIRVPPASLMQQLLQGPTVLECPPEKLTNAAGSGREAVSSPRRFMGALGAAAGGVVRHGRT